MSKPVSALNSFQNQTGPIPLSQLDANFTSLFNAANDIATYSNYLVDSSGTPNLITCTPAVGLAFAYTAGIWIEVKVANTNTSTTVNINVNALGNQLIKNPDGSVPSVGQIVAGGIYALQYDGTNFQIIGGTAGFTGLANPTGTIGLAAVNGTATTAMRSDGAPALSQGIAPTWTAAHTFAKNAADAAVVKGDLALITWSNTAGTPVMQSGCVNAWIGSGGNLTDAAIGAIGANLNLYVSGLSRSHIGINQSALTFGNATDNPTYTFQGTGAASFGGSVTASAAGSSLKGLTTIAAPASGKTLQVNVLDNATGFDFNSTTVTNGWFGTFSRNGTVTGYLGLGPAMFTGGALADFGMSALSGAVRFSKDGGATTSTILTSSGVLQTIDDGGTLQTVGWRDIPQNLQTISYQLVLSDRGKGVDFNGTTLTCTIPANGTVAFPIGTTIVISNLNASNLSIAITTDTLTLAGTTTTGTRTLSQNGQATIRKTASTSWLISGAGLT